MFSSRFFSWKYGFYASVLLLSGWFIPAVGFPSAILFLLAVGIAVGPRSSTAVDFPSSAVDAQITSAV